MTPDEFARILAREDAGIREGMRADRRTTEPVFDDEEFYDGHLEYDGDDQ